MIAAPIKPQPIKHIHIKKTARKVQGSAPFQIIGIGTSAGGLEALKIFFDNVPEACPHSFIVIQHLSPDYKSMMADLLSKNTRMPIYEVKNKMKIKQGSVYLIPPKKNMTMKNGRLFLKDKPGRKELNMPIDIFFRSLAEEQGENTIGLILSGTGSDGTGGLRVIKEAGGMVMVQNPDQAKFDGMPRSAISTGLADYILPIEHMPEELINFTSSPRIEKESQFLMERERLTDVMNHIRNITELDFSWYKRPTIIRRIARRMSINKCENLREYLKFLYESPHESHVLSRELLIGVTRFFRDAPAWESLAEKVLSQLVKDKPLHTPIKVWSVACSTGEEAYSIAILLKEEMERQGSRHDVKIFATDISKTHLDIAGKGIYPESIVEDISIERLKKYFIRKGDQYQVTDDLRRMVIFSHHNVMEDPPFNKMDLVTCRNMLIYYQSEIQEKVISILHYALNLDGALFLGTSESIGHHNAFEEVDRKWKIYRNTELARALGKHALPFSNGTKLQSFKPANGLHTGRATVETRLAELLNEAFTDEFNAASVYVDQNFDILHAIGDIRHFITLPQKGFSVNLLKMLPNNVRVAVSSTVRKAEKQNKQVWHSGVLDRKDKKERHVKLIVKPFHLDPANGKPNYLIVFFEEKVDKVWATEGSDNDPSALSSQYQAELEDELKATRENLQATIEEVESFNEELQATNEELMASNEELQSTNEELQSVNEELHTVNSELEMKVEEITGLNADMDNLLKSSEIGTIFLDKDLCIRKFTPAIKKHFNLMDRDIGRPIRHFTSHIGNSNIGEDAKKVLENGLSLRREIQTDDGKWYLKHVTPFQNARKERDGVVISFVEIDQIKKAEILLRESESRFRSMFENANEGVILVDQKGNIEMANPALMKMFCYQTQELDGMSIDLLFPFPIRKKYLQDEEDDHKNILGQNREVFGLKKNGDIFPVQVSLSPLDIQDKKYSLALIVDVTDTRRREKKLRQSEEKFRSVFANAPVGITLTSLKMEFRETNKEFRRIVGYSDYELKKMTVEDITHPLDQQQTQEQIDLLLKDKVDHFQMQKRYLHKDGTVVWSDTAVTALRDADGNPTHLTAIVEDITKVKKAEEELRESEEKFRSVFTNAPVGITLTTLTGEYLETNKEFRRIVGYSDTKLKKMKIEDIIYPPDMPQTQEKINMLLQGKIDHYLMQKRYLRKDRKIVWTNTAVTVIKDADGKPMHKAAIVEDITKMKHAEQELRESEERYRVIYEEDPLMHVNFEPKNATIINCNKLLVERLGYKSKNDLIGKPLFYIYHPDSIEDAKKALRMFQSTGKVENVELALKKRNGSKIPVTLNVSSVCNDKGKTLYCISSWAEIGELRRTQRELKKLNESLEEKVRERTEHLKRSNRELEEFAYVASHDLKAPVTNLDSLLKLMKASGHDERFELLFEKVQHSVSHLNSTITSLNKVIALKKNIHLERKQVKFQDILDEVILDVENLINDSKTKIETDFSQCEFVNFPPVHLKHILQNLITNSIKYRKTNRYPIIHIKSRYNKAGEKICLTVRDNGQGIDLKKYGNKIFGLFQRLSLDTKGEGIGLHITKSIVESYGGHIEVKSQVGKGSVFNICLAQ